MQDKEKLEFEISLNKNLSTSQKIKEGVVDFLKFAVIALIIVIPIRMFIAQPFIVSGDSMFPTFHNGEYLLVDELSYNLGNIKRGDVVIFRYPGDKKKFFIKRIIGMPNETITIENQDVEIRNKEFPEGFIISEPYLTETFYGKSVYNTDDREYFVMGDNRNKSSDSRFWGMVPEKLLVGRAYLRLLPVAHASYLPGSLKKYQNE